LYATNGGGELGDGVQAGSSFVAIQARAPAGRSFQIDAIMRLRGKARTAVGGGNSEGEASRTQQVCFSQEQLCDTQTDTDTDTDANAGTDTYTDALASSSAKPIPKRRKILSVPQERAHIQRVRTAVDALLLQRSREFHANFMKRLLLTEISSSGASTNGSVGADADGEADAWINNDNDAISPLPASAPSSSTAAAAVVAARRSFSAADIRAGKAALSSLLGGMGLFRGVPQVGDAGSLEHEGDGQSRDGSASMRGNAPEPAAPEFISLLSCTPSRTVFPRGFLWDEGT